MRVIAGNFKGHNLKTLKGDATRPTTMRVKESLFSTLVSLMGSFDDRVVFDAFAGSGALGIEALSRGASFVVFCEKSKQAASVVRDNLNKVHANKETYSVELGDSERAVKRHRKRFFDLAFFDPPYIFEPEQVLALVQSLDEAGSLAHDALICYELAKMNKEACLTEAHRLKWEPVSLKDHGDTTIVILRREQ